MKKVLSMAMAAMLVLGMGAAGFGAKADKVEKDDIRLGASTTASQNIDSWESIGDDDRVRKIDMKLVNGSWITEASVKESKLAIQIRATEGSTVVDSAKIKYYDQLIATPAAIAAGATTPTSKIAYVEFKLKKGAVTTKDVDFSVKLYVTVDKSRANASEITVSGTYKYEDRKVGEGEQYIYLGDSPYVTAEAYIKEIQVDLGQNVSIYTRMFEGKKYFGKVTQDVTADDEAVFNKYPDINTVYKLDTVNLNSTGDTVKFDLDGNLYIYVQDEDGNLAFLGRTADRVPYFTKYFLSSKELDVEETPSTEGPSEEGSGSTEEPSDGGPTGGDDAPIANVNDNPGTGR